MAGTTPQAEAMNNGGAAGGADAVKELVEDPRAWPLVRYIEQVNTDWLKVTNAWTAVALGFIEVVLAFRLGFRLAAANAENGFVNLIYDVSGPLAWPFEGVLADTRLGSGAFQPSVLVAMLVYFVAAVLLMSVAWAIVQTNEARDRPPEGTHIRPS